MDSELAGLMPNNLQRGFQNSSLDTREIRKYMKSFPVLSERGNVPPQSLHTMKKPHADDLVMRKGSGRVPQARRFSIRIKKPQGASPLPPPTDNLDPEELKDALLQQAIAQRRILVTSGLRPGSGRVVKRANIVINIRLPVAPPQALVFDAPSEPSAQGAGNTSQLAQLAKTPAGLLAHYPSPIEGVPERLSGRRNNGAMNSTAAFAPEQQPSPQGYTPVEGLPELRAMFRPPPSRLGSNQFNPSQPGHSPMEGLPELRQVFQPPPSRLGAGQGQARPVSAPIPPYIPSAVAAVPGDDSPVEGLVHHAAAPAGPRLLSAPSPPAPFAFPSPLPPRNMTEMAVQTGASIQGSAEKDPMGGNQAQAPMGDFTGAADAGPAGFDDYGDDDFGGGDDGGYDGGWDDYGDAEAPAPMPSPGGPSGSMPPPPPRPPRRIIKNPGINLRKQLPRKSLSMNPNVGLQEVAPGMRRSMRTKNEPLKWWLNEKKEFTRTAHRTMPTVRNMTHTTPNTPWQTVSDPNEWKGRRKAGGGAAKVQRGAGAGAGAAGGNKKSSKGAGGRKRKATEVEEAPGAELGSDDEIELRAGPEMPPADSDDEETELLPRENQGGPTSEEEAGEEEVEGGGAGSPSPVRAIDLTSPVDLVSPSTGRKQRNRNQGDELGVGEGDEEEVAEEALAGEAAVAVSEDEPSLAGTELLQEVEEDGEEGTSTGVRMARTARVGAKKKKGKGTKKKARR